MKPRRNFLTIIIIDNMFTAFIPIKEKSERVKNKNFRKIDEKPLFYFILNTLTTIKQITEIVIDHDTDKVRSEIEKYFDNLKFTKRGEHLLDPHESVNKIIEANLENFKNKFIFQTHVTNPLLTKETIESSLNKFLIHEESLFSVTKHQARFYNSEIDPLNHDLGQLLSTQHLEPWYEENSNFYIFSKEQFLKNKSRINQASKIHIVSKTESIDIDTEEDLELVVKLIGK